MIVAKFVEDDDICYDAESEAEIDVKKWHDLDSCGFYECIQAWLALMR